MPIDYKKAYTKKNAPAKLLNFSHIYAIYVLVSLHLFSTNA